MGREVSQQHLDAWNKQQAIAEKMIPLLGSLYRGPSVVIRVFGENHECVDHLYYQSTSAR